MQTITIYKRKGDTFIISPKRPKGEYTLLYRYKKNNGAIAYTSIKPDGEYAFLYKRKAKKPNDEYIELYRYKGENGGTILSTVKPECEHTVVYKHVKENGIFSFYLTKPNSLYTLMYRLIADEGKVLVKGGVMTTSVDVESPEGWVEMTDATGEATVEDYINALAELGVTNEEGNT